MTENATRELSKQFNGHSEFTAIFAVIYRMMRGTMYGVMYGNTRGVMHETGIK